MLLFSMHVLEFCAVPPAAGERVVVCAVILLLVVAVLEEHQADLARVPRDGRWDVEPVVIVVEFGADALELLPLGVGHGNSKPSMFAHKRACHQSATWQQPRPSRQVRVNDAQCECDAGSCEIACC